MSENIETYRRIENEKEEKEKAMPSGNRIQSPPKNVQTNTGKAEHSEDTILDKLKTLSINGELDEMRKFAKSATYVAGRLALAGQVTVFYAGPNTGKTLISLKLISEAVANGAAGDHVYHINLFIFQKFVTNCTKLKPKALSRC